MKACKYVLAIDAGGTFFKSCIVSSDGIALQGSQNKILVDSNSCAENIVAAYAGIIEKAFEFSGANGITLCGIGVSTPGPFDYKNGVSLMKHKFPNLYGLPLRQKIITRCTVEVPVCFTHDANAFIEGEHWKGAAAGVQNAAGITIGTGTGFGVILNGNLMTNEEGGPFYSVYRRPYNGSILEEYISRRGIIRLYKKLSGRSDEGFDVIDIEHFALRDNDPSAVETFAQTGKIIAENIGPVIEELGIECFVLGGQISKGYGLMANELGNGLQGVKCLKQVAKGADIDNSPLIGAALGVFKQIRKVIAE